MNKNLKEKLPLVVGIGLPILLIIYVGLSSYLSALFVKPQYDFIYTSGTSSYNDNLQVEGGRITTQSYNYSSSYQNSTANLYYYDARNDRSRSITLSEAEMYTLDPSSKSPDGFTVEASNGGSIFWDISSENGYYLKGHGFNKKINITADQYNFRFLGWVTANE